jgi:beta-glucosidase
LGYARGNFPPGRQDPRLAMRVQANMLLAHAAAYRRIHEMQKEARVGYAMHYRPMEPRTSWSPLDRLLRNLYYSTVNWAFPSAISSGVMRTPLGNMAIPQARGTQDYFGLNYYSTDTVSFDLRRPRELFVRSGYPPDADLSETGFIANRPEGLFQSLKWIVRTYPDTPILITENGIESSDDEVRRRYLARCPSDLARRQLQLAGQGLFSLDAG